MRLPGACAVSDQRELDPFITRDRRPTVKVLDDDTMQSEPCGDQEGRTTAASRDQSLIDEDDGHQ